VRSEVNSVHKYKSAEDRVVLAKSERNRVTALCQQIIDLKEKICTDGQGFVVINQKGIDPLSLDMLARADIMALRRAKRRNMERLTLACGGTALNSLDGLCEEDLGRAGLVYEHVLGENKFTFVEKVENPFSCTLLVKGMGCVALCVVWRRVRLGDLILSFNSYFPCLFSSCTPLLSLVLLRSSLLCCEGPNKHTLHQIKDAIRDGLRAVKNVIEDKALVPGAGAFEIYAHEKLRQFAETVDGKKKLGVVAIADALLVVPKTLAVNSGFDPLDTIIVLQEAARGGSLVGLDLDTGKAMDPAAEGVWDNYAVKKQLIDSW
jgi:T-complex protein 1 subunit zeta